MSQDQVSKQMQESKLLRGHFFGIISNIDHTLEMFLQSEVSDDHSLNYKMQEEALKNSYEVKIIEETLTKGLINAKIIASKLDTRNAGASILAKLAIMGNMSKESEEKD